MAKGASKMGGGVDPRQGQRFPFIIPGTGSYDWRVGEKSSGRTWATIASTVPEGGRYVATYEDNGVDYDVYRTGSGQFGFTAVRRK